MPAQKRAKRTHSDPLFTPSTNGAQRHPDLYFEDGNIVLLAENTYFKVYKGTLTRNSTVFHDILSIPQEPTSTTDSEQYDSCPLIELLDFSEDVEHILSALYNEINQ